MKSYTRFTIILDVCVEESEESGSFALALSERYRYRILNLFPDFVFGLSRPIDVEEGSDTQHYRHHDNAAIIRISMSTPFSRPDRTTRLAFLFPLV